MPCKEMNFWGKKIAHNRIGETENLKWHQLKNIHYLINLP